MMGSAATVSPRYPPPSWKRMMLPGRTDPSIRSTMAVEPGSDQSRGSTDQRTERNPRDAATPETRPSIAPSGGRNQSGRIPVATRMAACV